MNILVANRQRSKKINPHRLREIVRSALTELGVAHCELEINLLHPGQMTALNETFLKHGGSTDVITFDYSEGRRLRSHVRLSGEIFISVDDAATHARQFKTRWQHEVIRCAIHGILHLLGFDDSRLDSRRKMKREETRLLRLMERRFSLAELSRPAKIRA